MEMHSLNKQLNDTIPLYKQISWSKRYYQALKSSKPFVEAGVLLFLLKKVNILPAHDTTEELVK